MCEGLRTLEAPLLPRVPHTVLRGEVSLPLSPFSLSPYNPALLPHSCLELKWHPVLESLGALLRSFSLERLQGPSSHSFPQGWWRGPEKGAARTGRGLLSSGGLCFWGTGLTPPGATELHPKPTFVFLGAGGERTRGANRSGGHPDGGAERGWRMRQMTEAGREGRSELRGGAGAPHADSNPVTRSWNKPSPLKPHCVHT